MRRFAFGVLVVAVTASTVAAFHSPPQSGVTASKAGKASKPIGPQVQPAVNCPVPLPSGGLPRALPASLAILRSALPGCLKLFSAGQPGGGQPQVQAVQGVGNCSMGSAFIRVTALNLTGKLSIAEYQKRVGTVIASIENISDCTTAGIQIPSGRTAYWVVDREVDPKNPNTTVPMSHVFDPVTEADVVGGGPKVFKQCPANPVPMPKGDLAFFTTTANPCVHGVRPGATFAQIMAALPVTSAAFKGLRGAPDDPPATMWIACGAQCCYASTDE